MQNKKEPAKSEKTNAEKGIKLFFGIPAFGGLLHSPFVRSYLATQQAGLIQQVVHVDGDSLVCRARNNLTAEFLNSDCTHLLFIDTDIVFEPWHVRRLIDHAARGLPIVAGLYPKKQQELAWVINTMKGEKTGEHGLRRLKYAGTGFMLIAREVFTRLRTALPDIAYVSDHGELGPNKREIRHDFWPVGVYHTKEQKANGEPGRYLSEDWYFCQNLEDLDIPVMCDMGVHTKHIGQVAYPLAEVPLVDKEGNKIQKAVAPKEEITEMDSPPEMQPHIEKIFAGEYDFENPIKDGDTIMDIGANCGGFARWAHVKWPNSKIACFEPIQDNFEFLQKNVAGIPQIQIGKFAIVGPENMSKKYIEMFKGKNNPGECSIYDLGEQNLEEKETVETMSASELPPAQFYKLDCEGSELDIIERLNLSEAKALVCEWHRAEDHLKIKELLEENGWICDRDDKRSLTRGILAFVKQPNSKKSEADNNS